MILYKKTVHLFLCQANIIEWNSTNKYATTFLKGKNNNIRFQNNTIDFLLKQSLREDKYVQEGILHEVYFYSWLKKLPEYFTLKKNFICLIGYEHKNRVSIFEFKKNTRNPLNRDIDSFFLDNLLSVIFCFHGLKFENEFLIPIREKPNVWELINEKPTTSELPKKWFETRNIIRNNSVLKELLDELLTCWEPKYLCNADIKLDNFLVEKKNNQVYWIDWERFCLADELWDVGGLLRLIFFEHLKISKDLNLILDDRVFQERVSQIWRKIHSMNPKVSKDKLLLIWIASILEKTLELAQEGTVDLKMIYFLIEICEEIQAKSNIIKILFN